jgi:hypothetical protein
MSHNFMYAIYKQTRELVYAGLIQLAYTLLGSIKEVNNEEECFS